MDPLHPSFRLLRRMATELAASEDRCVRAWAAAMAAQRTPRRAPEFLHVSIVATFRAGRLCGYEVWRHLESSRVDPKRRKARLWFGRRRHGARTLALARDAARLLESMSPHELHEWWAEYRAARVTGRRVGNLWRDEERFTNGYAYEDLQSVSHVFAKVG